MIDEEDDGSCRGGTARGATVNRGVVVVVAAVAVVVAVVCTGVAEDAPDVAAVVAAVAPAIGAVTSVALAVNKTSVSSPRRVDASVELGRDVSECCSR
jgi:flagellar basal body-associated protein FliL